MCVYMYLYVYILCLYMYSRVPNRRAASNKRAALLKIRYLRGQKQRIALQKVIINKRRRPSIKDARVYRRFYSKRVQVFSSTTY
jgi:hypothetical protein